MNELDLIKKLIRHHRRELTEIIGPFRARTPPGAWHQLELVSRRDGAMYFASVTRSHGDGEPDWLNVNDMNGRYVATLN
jgi:hypothetical protein